MILLTYKFIIIIIVLVYDQKCECLDHLNVNIYNNSKQNILCKYTSDDPARHCIDFERTVRTDVDRENLLYKINTRRNKVAAGEIRSLPPAANMQKLEWNRELERSAQRWANQCVKHYVPDIQDSCRDLDSELVGQNIATLIGEAPGLSVVSLVDVWYMELLNMNKSVINIYQPSFVKNYSHYDYFTQLVWAESNQVGCGGVKFKERYVDEISVRNRTIYRLVCNFAPGGNRWNNSVYNNGLPCSQCPPYTTCDVIHKSLCKKEVSMEILLKAEEKGTTDTLVNLTTVSNIDTMYKTSVMESSLNYNITQDHDNVEDYTYISFDFMSDLHKSTRQAISQITTKTNKCKESLEIDDFVELLKKKLSDDPIFKQLLATKTSESLNGEIAFTDPSVEAFVSKIYSKMETATTKTTIDIDYVNSTLLVDLVEAVIFKSGGHVASDSPQDTQTLSEVTPVKIQAELPEIKQSYDFTGHYFFPEDSEDTTTEVSNTYDELLSSLPLQEVVLEIEDFKKNSLTKDFIEEIIDSESITENTSTQTSLSPDDMTVYKSGHSVMKKFLKDIEDSTRES